MEEDCDRVCWICFESEEESVSEFISPCRCVGSLKWVHVGCISDWVNSSHHHSSRSSCRFCRMRYQVSEPELPTVHRLLWHLEKRLGCWPVQVLMCLALVFVEWFHLRAEENNLWFALLGSAINALMSLQLGSGLLLESPFSKVLGLPTDYTNLILAEYLVAAGYSWHLCPIRGSLIGTRRLLHVFSWTVSRSLDLRSRFLILFVMVFVMAVLASLHRHRFYVLAKRRLVRSFDTNVVKVNNSLSIIDLVDMFVDI